MKKKKNESRKKKPEKKKIEKMEKGEKEKRKNSEKKNPRTFCAEPPLPEPEATFFNEVSPFLISGR
jgi:hypothetical protein